MVTLGCLVQNCINSLAARDRGAGQLQRSLWHVQESDRGDKTGAICAPELPEHHTRHYCVHALQSRFCRCGVCREIRNSKKYLTSSTYKQQLSV